MASTVNRYRDLLNSRPSGRFYADEGEVLPYTDKAHEFRFQTNRPNRTFQTYLNEVPQLPITTDANGLAIFRTERNLPAGTYSIRIWDPVEDLNYRDTITRRHIATIYAAYADVLEELETDIDNMFDALSISTVGAEYIESVYGVKVRQPKPSNFLIEDYRNLLISLRQAYRHFGAHPYGVKQAVEGFTSVSPVIVSKHWRPRWILGTDLSVNGDLSIRSRDGLALDSITPVGSTNELPDLNRQSRYYIHPGVGTSLTTTGFRQPPTPQKLTITVDDATTVTLIGVDERGISFSEIIPDPSITPAAGTYLSFKIYSEIVSGEKSGGVNPAQVGLGDSRFIEVTQIGPYTEVGATVALDYSSFDSTSGRTSLKLGGGSIVAFADGDQTLKDVARKANALGTTSTFSTFNLSPSAFPSNSANYHDKLYVQLDEILPVTVDFAGSTVTPAAAVTAINTALGVSRASTVTGDSGYNADIMRLVSGLTGPTAEVKFLPGPGDASVRLFGLPRSSSHLSATISGTTVVLESTEDLPSENFDIRIRGLKRPQNGVANGVISPGVSNHYCSFSSVTYSFTLADVGGYVRLTTGSNQGIHKIVAKSGFGAFAILQHATPSGSFTSESLLDYAVYSPGEIVTVVSNNTGTNTLTLETATVFASWPQGAIAELIDEAPYTAKGTDGVGTLDITIDSSLRPFHEFGDSLTYSAGSVTLNCARANFNASVIGDSIVVSNTTTTGNDGTFTITSVPTSTSLIYSNPSGTTETSDFEWEINSGFTAISDSISVSADCSVLPDGWSTTASYTISATNVESTTTTNNAGGLLVPSRILLQAVPPGVIALQRNFEKALDFKGLNLSVAFWVGEHTADSTDYTIEVSFDDGVNFFTVSSTTSPAATVLNYADSLGSLDPFEVKGSFFVPWNAETCIIRLTRTPTVSDYGSMSFEKMTLISDTSPGLFLGTNTVIRSPKRSSFGELLYVWTAEELTSPEKTYLGLSTVGSSVGDWTVKKWETEDQESLELTPTEVSNLSSDKGHIDYITNAHGFWDRVEVSELDDSGSELIRNNLVGSYSDVEWTATEEATLLQNCEVIVGTPGRLSYVRPTRLTSVEAEALTTFDGGDGVGYARADLGATSNHSGSFPQDPNTGTGTGARLYEVPSADSRFVNPDGLVTFVRAGDFVPLPDSEDVNSVQPWEFISATQIRINSPYYNASSTYFLDYDVAMSVTTAPFSLDQPGGDFADYVWLTDMALYKRHDVVETFRARTQQAEFGTDLIARLKEVADTTVAATLIANNGKIETTVPSSNWRFTDSRNIRIDSGVFDTSAIYSITYTAKIATIVAPTTFTLQWKSAELQGDLSTSTWEDVTLSQVVTPRQDPNISDDVTLNNINAWNQLRVLVNGVTDVRDFRLYGLGLKGIHLYGSEANAPGLLTP